MTKFESIKKSGQIYTCDLCKKDIQSEDIITVEAVDNINILAPVNMFIYINKDGIIVGSRTQPSKVLGDMLLACPYCKTPHLFGFDKKK